MEFDAQAQHDLAVMAKRRGEHANRGALGRVVDGRGCVAAACEELAVYHEKRGKDYQKALEFAQLGLRETRKKLGRMNYLNRTAGELRRAERLMKRVARLETKLNAERIKESAPLLRRRSAVLLDVAGDSLDRQRPGETEERQVLNGCESADCPPSARVPESSQNQAVC